MTTTEERLAEIRARHDAIFDGPWAIWRDLDHQGFYTVGDAASYEEVLKHGQSEDCNPAAHVYVEPDAEFIAHAPADIEWLLSRLAEAEAEKGRWHDAALTGVAEEGRLTDRLAEAEATIQRVRELHAEGVAYADDSYGPEPLPDDYERQFCHHDGEDYPCPTVRAIEGSTK